MTCSHLLRGAPHSLAAALILGSVALTSHAQYKVIGADGRVTYTDRPSASTGDQISPIRSSVSGDTAANAGLPNEVRQAMQRYPVTLFVTDNCSPCDSARQLLRQRGVPYSEKTVSTAEDVDALQRLTGGRDTPTISIGSQVVRGLSTESWTSYLDAAGYPKSSKLPASYQFATATPLTEKAATRNDVSARPPALLDGAKEVRPDASVGTGGGGTAGFRF
jgi:glutaredoxin